MSDIIEWNQLELKVNEIFRRMGWPDPDSGRSLKYRPIIFEARKRALELIKVKCSYRIVPIQIKDFDQILFDGIMTISCKQKFFLGATEAAVAIMTIGPELEQEVSRLNNCGELLSGLALDACGSVAIDEVLERFRGFLATEVAKRQRVLGHNLSPGGQFVPIEVQAVLFTMLEAEKVEVTLNDSYLMIPIKSETMIIPLGEQLEMIDKSTILSCDLCPGKNTCTHRRQKLSDFGGSGHTESKLGIEQLDHTGTFEGHDSCNNNCGQSCNCEH